MTKDLKSKLYRVEWEQWCDYDHLHGDWESEHQFFSTKKEAIKHIMSIKDKWNYRNFQLFRKLKWEYQDTL